MRLVGLFLLLAACGSPATSGVSTPAPTASAVASAPATSAPSTLKIASSRYGSIIVDRTGHTLYLFDAEASPAPKCYGPCANAWPPLLTSTAPIAGPGLDQALIATAARTDGSKQVTYNGHPLYFYVGDHAAGDIKCQAVIEFGGGWYVLDARGNKIARP